MKVAITSADTFVAPYIQEMLGDSAILVPEESLADPLALDALLTCLLYTSPSPRDQRGSRMPSSA